MWMVASNRNRISSWELHRALKVTQKTAWFVLHRIRLGMQDETGRKLGGEVEVDDTFIGDKARNVRKEERERKVTGRGTADKEIVLGMVEQDGIVLPFTFRVAESLSCRRASGIMLKPGRRSSPTNLVRIAARLGKNRRQNLSKGSRLPRDPQPKA